MMYQVNFENEKLFRRWGYEDIERGTGDIQVRNYLSLFNFFIQRY